MAGMAGALDVDAMLARFRERAAAVKKRRVTTYWDWLDDRRPSVHEQGCC